MTDQPVKLPYMPLWVLDIDADRDCRAMRDAEFGRYMRLLMRQWVEGSVPGRASDAVRDAMLDAGSEEAVQSLLDRKFSATDGNVRRNERCDTERQNAVAKVLKMRKLGAKGGSVRSSARSSVRSSVRSSRNLKKRAPKQDCLVGGGVVAEGGAGETPVVAILSRMKGGKSKISEVAALLDCPSAVVALWRDISQDESVDHPVGCMAARLKQGTPLPTCDAKAIIAARDAGIVHRVNGIDVTNGVKLGWNSGGLTVDGKLAIATKDMNTADLA